MTEPRKKGRQGRRYSDEFKREAVQLLTSTPASTADVSAQLQTIILQKIIFTTRIRSLSFVLILLTNPYLYSTELSSECKRNQEYFGDPLVQRFNLKCLESLKVCRDTKMSNSNLNRREAFEACSRFPLISDSRYLGPCPELLDELENPIYDGLDSIVSRAELRSHFVLDGVIGLDSSYKFEESKQELLRLLDVEPNNIGALLQLKFRLDPEKDVLQDLRIEMKLQDLDPGCSFDWPLRANFIPNTVHLLITNNMKGEGVGSRLTDSELSELVNQAWNTLLSMYDYAYSTSTNIRKLSYALQSIYNPIFIVSTPTIERVSTLLDIDPIEYVDHRREFIVNNLNTHYGVDSDQSRSQSLGMICNDYAFEIGVFDQCPCIS